MSGDDAPPVRPDLDLVALIDVLELIAPDAIATSITAIDDGRGGRASDLVLVQRGEHQIPFVVRRHLDPAVTPADVLRTVQTMESLRPTPVPAPELLWVDADGATFGRPAIAMTHLAGTDGLRALADDPPGTAALLAEQVVAVTWVPAPSLDHLPRPTTGEELIAWFVGPVSGLDDGGLLDGLAEALDRVEPRVPVLAHGDLHAGNLLVEDGRVTGILDWGAAAVADPRVDLASAYVSTWVAVGEEPAAALLAAHADLRGATEGLDPFVRLAMLRALPLPTDDWRRAWARRDHHVDAGTLTARFRSLRARHT